MIDHHVDVYSFASFILPIIAIMICADSQCVACKKLFSWIY